MDSEQLSYMRTRLTHSLDYAAKLGLLDLLCQADQVEQMTLLFVSIRVSGPLPHLAPNKMSQLVDIPLQKLSQQCSRELQEEKSSDRLSLAARLSNLCAVVRPGDGLLDERAAAVKLHALLVENQDCTVRVDPPSPGARMPYGRTRLSADEVARPPYKDKEPPRAISFNFTRPGGGDHRNRQQQSGVRVSNAFGALAANDDAAHDAANDNDGHEAGNDNDDAIEAEMALQRNRDSATTILQARANRTVSHRDLPHIVSRPAPLPAISSAPPSPLPTNSHPIPSHFIPSHHITSYYIPPHPIPSLL